MHQDQDNQEDIEAHKLYAEGLVKSRANRASFLTSHTLEQITKCSILRNKEYFCRLAKLQPLVNPLDKISPNMKKELIELESVMQIEDWAREIDVGSKQQQQLDVSRQCLMLQLLLNQKMTSFHFPLELTSANRKDVWQLWRSLLFEKPSNLISIVSEKGIDENEEPQLNWNVRSFVTKMLPVFPGLEVLRIEHFSCKNADLKTIAQHLSKLRVLEVELSLAITEQGIEALRQLTLLEEFIFTEQYMTADDYELRMLASCYKLLPHLHEVAIKPTPFSNSQVQILAYSSIHAIQTIRQPHTLLLHHLVLLCYDNIPLHVTFPELQVLYLNKPWEDMQLFEAGRFPKLVELNIECHHIEPLMSAVRFGAQKQLRTLRVNVLHSRNNESMLLDELLDACPNLKELCLNGISWGSTGELRPETLSQLTILRCHSEGWATIQPGLVVQLLKFAPNLCKVEIFLAMLQFEDLEQLAELVEQRACLQHLERLHVILNMKRIPNRSRKLLDKLIINCSIYCEKLSDVVVDTSTPWYYEDANFE